MRTMYLRTVSPTLSPRTYQFLEQNIGFGDWLLLVMMALHLDIKLFSDILLEIEEVEEGRSRSCSVSTGVEMWTSDTEYDHDKVENIVERESKVNKGCLKTTADMLTLKVDKDSGA